MSADRLSWGDVETLRKAGLGEAADTAVRYLTKRTWRSLWRKPRPSAVAAGQQDRQPK